MTSSFECLTVFSKIIKNTHQNTDRNIFGENCGSGGNSMAVG